MGEINQEITAIAEDDVKLQALLQNRNVVFQNLLLVIRGSFIDYDVQEIGNAELKLLQSKISINRSRGNTVAVQRDRYTTDYILIKRKMGAYVVYLVEASRDYKAKDEIIKETQKRIKSIKNKINSISAALEGDSEIYQDVEKNRIQLLRVYTVYQDFLEYVLANPDKIVTTSFIQKISLISAISYFNSLDVFRDINFNIAPMRIDMGGIIVSMCIILLNIIAFPFVSRASNRLVERFILNDGKVENIELVFVSMHKPILYLMLFFGIDLALNALLYKTEVKITIDYLIYFIYSGLYIYLLFNLIDSVAAVHSEQANRRNQAYSKELVILLVKTLKGVVFLVVLTLLLSHLGINITAILSTLGIGGLAFAMAAKDSLSNFFGGLNIMIDRIFKMGDWIKIGDVEGTVVEIGLRSTTVRTFDNALVTMPNSLVSTASVLNWNRRSVGRRIKMHIGVTYESNMDDIRQALEDIKQMLAEHPGIASPKEKDLSKQARNKFLSQEDVHGIKATQLVYLDRYNDFSIDILIYCFSKTVNWEKWLEVKQDVLFKIADILEKNNLSFAYPTNVQINRDEESSTLGRHDLLAE
ncbi:mechanosensitive ion channel family protein [Bathymodiolus platifrons methanotrophic gill symbiont]|uniref:mechanosensitive ion channel family protein n=1 Tax=Bathymodiolus platifrons methanotrophic gill symbiont TaxID=113268 RepID=UPI00142E652B|nr:mechanosensitive ion channel family protein [Bathymodiolus platifrons methanotrophic gill symbiont]